MKLLRIKYYVYILIAAAVLAAGYGMLHSDYSFRPGFKRISSIAVTDSAKEIISESITPSESIHKRSGSPAAKHSHEQSPADSIKPFESGEAYYSSLGTILPEKLVPPNSYYSPINQNPYREEKRLIPVRVPGFSGEIGNAVMTGASDAFSLVSNPLKWESNDYLKLGVILSGTALLYTMDNQIHRSFTSGAELSNSELIKFGNFYGETKTTQLTALGIGTYGFIFNDKRAMQLGLEIFESYLLADNITGLLKYSLGRSRPSENNGPYEFRMFDRAKRKCALPSGHATLAFSMSAILASYTDDTHLKIIIYIPAVITGMARIYENHHWASDVFLGAAIGQFVGSFIVSRHNPFRTDGVEFGFDPEGRPGIKLHF